MKKFAFLLIFGLIFTTAAKDTNNYFSSPSSRTGINPEWAIGDKQVISWKTTIGAFNISLWQQSMVEQTAISQVNIFSKIHASDEITNFTWVVQTYNYDLEYSNMFFLWINSDRPGGFVSSFFNITQPATTSTAGTAAATASPTVATVAGSTDSVDSASSSSSASGGSDGDPVSSSEALTMTGKIALGVGLGVGIPILAALGVLIWLRHKKSPEVPTITDTSHYSETIVPNGGFVPPLLPNEMGGREISRQYYPELPSQKH